MNLDEFSLAIYESSLIHNKEKTMENIFSTAGRGYQLDLANFYAVEILTSILDQPDPSQDLIDLFEEKIKSHITTIHTMSDIKRKKILIISSNNVEQNYLITALHHVGNFDITKVKTKKSLEHLCDKKPHYDFIFISEQFKEIIDENAVMCFSNKASKLVAITCKKEILYKRNASEKILIHPFLFEDIKNIVA